MPSSHKKIWGTLGTLGIVYGDIGTSPLYALKSCFTLAHLPVSQINVLGILSIFLWTLFLIISMKYVRVVLAMDDQGEGGILVLSTLAARYVNSKKTIFLMGILGFSLFLSDGVITPAISVLSALEGLHMVSPLFESYILILAIILIVGLFAIQYKGTAHISFVFSPIMVLWFLTLAILGGMQIIKNPSILLAFNPQCAFVFMVQNKFLAFAALSGTILVVTGAEALYADLGHFGKEKISLSWTFIVLPSLVLNYLGQGSILLEQPESLSNPFFALASPEFLYPLIILATLATIIASQALITGVFSVCSQAVMLNYLPRMSIRHTSTEHYGQTYLPAINSMLFICTVWVMLHFESSENLVAAYGFSVAGVMLITTLLTCLLLPYRLKWKKWKIALYFTPILFIEVIFFAATVTKIPHGAWFTLGFSALIFNIIRIWVHGNKALQSQEAHSADDIETFYKKYAKKYSERIPGTLMVMTRHITRVPSTFLRHLEHNHFLHQKTVMVSIKTLKVPKFKGHNRLSVKDCGNSLYLITAEYGFMETGNVGRIIYWAKENGIFKDSPSCIIGRSVPVASTNLALSGLSEKIYIFLSNLSLSADQFYKIPVQNVIEIGIRYKI